MLNESLLCQHQRLLYDPTDPNDYDRRMVLVWPREWQDLQSFYSVDHELSGTRDSLTGEVSLSPVLCDECLRTRREALQAELCNYKRAKIYVRRVADDTKLDLGQSPVVDSADPEFH
ncbi:hypothetical protein FOCC_FOCC006255, partial [Frankliniella occidentalis]